MECIRLNFTLCATAEDIPEPFALLAELPSSSQRCQENRKLSHPVERLDE